MTKKAIFEASTLADAVGKAARVAPRTGAAWDQAAGIIIRIRPGNADPAVVIATDLDVTFRQSITVLELGDEDCDWRVPSSLVANMLANMPSGSGNNIRLGDNGDSNLYFISSNGKSKAKLRQIMGNYPMVERFDPTQLVAVPHFAQRLAQVAWATDTKAASALKGVHIDGKRMYASNRSVLATVPCDVPVQQPITAPLSEVASMMRNTNEVSLSATPTRLLMMPDPYTQTSTVLLAEEFPSMEMHMKYDRYTSSFEVDAGPLADALDRMLVLVKAERIPVTKLAIAPGALKLEMDALEVGKMADEVEIVGGNQAMEMLFTPQYLRDALQASGDTKVTIEYGPGPLDRVRLTDRNGFTCIIMPRNG